MISGSFLNTWTMCWRGKKQHQGFPKSTHLCLNHSVWQLFLAYITRIASTRCTNVSFCTPASWMLSSSFRDLTFWHCRVWLSSRNLVSPDKGRSSYCWLGDLIELSHTDLFRPFIRYHQDSYYIPTQPNTLIAAWVAISDATEDNGCLWFRAGSQVEPTYPCPGNLYTQAASGLGGIFQNFTASVLEPTDNQLTGVAERYLEIPCPAKPGDVVFFRGNILHRSHANNSSMPRRAFVAHYCDARSFVPWNIGRSWQGMDGGKGANDLHILARGVSHLPYAHPRFGTPIQRPG